MKLAICVKPRLRHYQLWVAENETDWTMHGAKSADDVAVLVGEHAQRLRLETYPDVLVVDEDRNPVPMPTELKAALGALGRQGAP